MRKLVMFELSNRYHRSIFTAARHVQRAAGGSAGGGGGFGVLLGDA